MSVQLTKRKIKNHVDVARETISTYGVDDADLHSIVAIILGKAVPPSTIGELTSLGIVQLSQLTERELLEHEGVTKNKCLILQSAFALAKKLHKYGKEDRYIIRSSDDAGRYLMDELRYCTQEHFVVLFLNTKNHVIRKKTIFIGCLDKATVHPREIYKEAVSCSAASIILAHNHPSNNPSPSKEDLEVTKRLVKCGEIMGIETLDHIIIGGNTFVSLKEKGYV